MTLDSKYERFAQLVFSGVPEHEAFLQVGYPKGSSYKANARRLCHHPKVKARVKELQSQAAACMVIDAAWLLGKVTRIAGYEIDTRHLKASDVIAAMALLAKMLPGALVPNQVQLGGDGDHPLVVERIERIIVDPADRDTEKV
jgi:phage terminase small subunit